MNGRSRSCAKGGNQRKGGGKGRPTTLVYLQQKQKVKKGDDPETTKTTVKGHTCEIKKRTTGGGEKVGWVKCWRFSSIITQTKAGRVSIQGKPVGGRVPVTSKKNHLYEAGSLEHQRPTGERGGNRSPGGVSSSAGEKEVQSRNASAYQASGTTKYLLPKEFKERQVDQQKGEGGGKGKNKQPPRS